MSDTMKAVVLTRFGGPDAFEIQTLPVPPVGSRQVRVRVHATAINPLDYQIRRGDYPDHVPLPAVIGHDVSGVVETIGADVTEFARGDEVYYTPKIFGGAGSYAEVHVADVDLVSRAGLRVGETILIHGGAGGVGTIAIQVAKAIGARVITTALAKDHDFVRALGADDAVDFTSTDYVDAVGALTGGHGVDVVFDTIGGDTLTRSPLVLAPLGRVVSLVDIAAPQNLIEAWGRNASYHFVFARQNRGKLNALTNLVERGLVRPVIGAVLPLERLAEGHTVLETGSRRGLRGKVAIDVLGEAEAIVPPLVAAA